MTFTAKNFCLTLISAVVLSVALDFLPVSAMEGPKEDERQTSGVPIAPPRPPEKNTARPLADMFPKTILKLETRAFYPSHSIGYTSYTYPEELEALLKEIKSPGLLLPYTLLQQLRKERAQSAFVPHGQLTLEKLEEVCKELKRGSVCDVRTNTSLDSVHVRPLTKEEKNEVDAMKVFALIYGKCKMTAYMKKSLLGLSEADRVNVFPLLGKLCEGMMCNFLFEKLNEHQEKECRNPLFLSVNPTGSPLDLITDWTDVLSITNPRCPVHIRARRMEKGILATASQVKVVFHLNDVSMLNEGTYCFVY